MPSATELMLDSLAMVHQADDLVPDNSSPNDNLRHKTITPRTQQPDYRSYLTAWVRKVEAIGRMNYPVDERRQRLHGRLRLDVALDAKGRVQHIDLLTSSGNPRLDQAAINIVKLGGPYSPLPPHILADTDILHIRRVWVFEDDAQPLQ